MPVVQFGNIYYFIYIAAFFLLTLILVRFLKHKSESYRYRFIYGLIILNLFVHFAKIFIYPYTTVEHIWTKVSFENICAVSVLTFPLLFFAKNRVLKDYMIMVGIASGIITFIFPVDAMSEYFNGAILGYKHAFSVETIRFYTSHYILFATPFLMMHYHMHELSIKRAYQGPLMLLLILVIIFINELLITWVGWVPAEDFFDPSKRNPSFIFGVRGDLSGLGVVLGVFVPGFLRDNPWFTGDAFFPVLWLLFPAIFYGGLIALSFAFVYDTDNTLRFFKLKAKLPVLEDSKKVSE